jgi:hypothetical protein
MLLAFFSNTEGFYLPRPAAQPTREWHKCKMFLITYFNPNSRRRWERNFRPVRLGPSESIIGSPSCHRVKNLSPFALFALFAFKPSVFFVIYRGNFNFPNSALRTQHSAPGTQNSELWPVRLGPHCSLLIVNVLSSSASSPTSDKQTEPVRR